MAGKFVISLDTELAWGTFDLPIRKRYEKHFSETRYVINEMLNMFSEHNISATWAIVGHLFLDECTDVNGVKHPEIVRPNFNWYQEDWFSLDPCSTIDEAPFWYGKDIVESIKNCRVHQEIGSHSFSHVIFGDRGCTYDVATTEIAAAKRLATEFGIELKSFVYPRNSEGYHRVLYEHGFICYRGKTNFWYDKLPNKLSRLAHFADQFFAIPPPSITPCFHHEGLVNIPDSMFYMPTDGIRKVIPINSRVSKAIRGLDRAVRNKEIFHLWFHPFNVGSNSRKLLDGLERIITYAVSLREKGKLTVCTMEEIANLFMNEQSGVNKKA